MNSKAIELLKSKPENDQVGKLQCRVKAGDVWKDWNDQEPSHTVAEMLDCLLNVPLEVTYEMCKDQWVSNETARRKLDLMADQIPGTDLECRYEWDFRYEPEKMGEKMINPDSVSIDDIIDCMIASPVPPPGWVMTPELAPLLCPLVSGPGWGCPDSPATEGDPPSNGGG